MPFGLRRISWIGRCRRILRRQMKMLRFAALLGLSVALQSSLRLKWYLYPLNFFALYCAAGGWRWTKVILLTLGRDVMALGVLIKVKRTMLKHIREGNTVAEIFHEVCLKNMDKPALINAETGKTLTFCEVEKLANQVANIFHEKGYKPGDCIALLMDGCPEYVCYWLGISKVGAVTALVNYSLRGDSLVHCISIVKARAVIYSSVYHDAVLEIKEKLDSGMEYFCADGMDTTLMNYSFQELLLSASTVVPPKPDGLNNLDKILYIYTSGTTGLPKAATIRNIRCLYLGFSLGEGFKTGPHDVGYISLPLYHSNGGLVGIGNCLFRGMPCVIRKKFSASRFIDDCIKYKVTVFFYIGEICRYLLSQPPRPEDKMHKVRLCVGNGMRKEIWEEFQSRFNIPQVGEFYGATETNAGMVNMVNKVGAVGFTSRLAPWVFPLCLVRVDPETREMLRGPDGLGIVCEPGEPGELVGIIRNDDPLKKFDGYANKESTKKKIAYDVLKKGDSVFLSGDVLVQDELGFFYFLDRTGDTFRWKGENVSTSEVESTISKILGLTDVVAYGVEFPGTEGKAGMVTIVGEPKHVDLDFLAEKCTQALPAYARPLFIRLSKEVQMTSTHKFQKTDLRKQGFDLNKVGNDEIYFLDGKTGKYEVVDDILFSKIMNMEMRV